LDISKLEDNEFSNEVIKEAIEKSGVSQSLFQILELWEKTQDFTICPNYLIKNNKVISTILDAKAGEKVCSECGLTYVDRVQREKEAPHILTELSFQLSRRTHIYTHI
jgi:hypothetical protein